MPRTEKINRLHPGVVSSRSALPLRLGLTVVFLLSLGSLSATRLFAQEPAQNESALTGTEQHTNQSPPAANTGEPSVAALGVRVFIDPETGELTSEPAPGQVEHLLALGRELALQRQQQSTPTGPTATPSTATDLVAHTVATFVTPFGLGAELDERFLQSLRVIKTRDGTLVAVCGNPEHGHPSPALEPSTPQVYDR